MRDLYLSYGIYLDMQEMRVKTSATDEEINNFLEDKSREVAESFEGIHGFMDRDAYLEEGISEDEVDQVMDEELEDALNYHFVQYNAIDHGDLEVTEWT